MHILKIFLPSYTNTQKMQASSTKRNPLTHPDLPISRPLCLLLIVREQSEDKQEIGRSEISREIPLSVSVVCYHHNTCSWLAFLTI